jgi:hypothetical protein
MSLVRPPPRKKCSANSDSENTIANQGSDFLRIRFVLERRFIDWDSFNGDFVDVAAELHVEAG